MLNQGLMRPGASTGDVGSLTVALRNALDNKQSKGPSALQATTKYGSKSMAGIEWSKPLSWQRRI